MLNIDKVINQTLNSIPTVPKTLLISELEMVGFLRERASKNLRPTLLNPTNINNSLREEGLVPELRIAFTGTRFYKTVADFLETTKRMGINNLIGDGNRCPHKTLKKQMSSPQFPLCEIVELIVHDDPEMGGWEDTSDPYFDIQRIGWQTIFLPSDELIGKVLPPRLVLEVYLLNLLDRLSLTRQNLVLS